MRVEMLRTCIIGVGLAFSSYLRNEQEQREVFFLICSMTQEIKFMFD